MKRKKRKKKKKEEEKKEEERDVWLRVESQIARFLPNTTYKLPNKKDGYIYIDI